MSFDTNAENSLICDRRLNKQSLSFFLLCLSRIWCYKAKNRGNENRKAAFFEIPNTDALRQMKNQETKNGAATGKIAARSFGGKQFIIPEIELDTAVTVTITVQD